MVVKDKKLLENMERLMIANESVNKDKIVDQYKIIVDSINIANQIRESSNNFWVTVNSLGISAIAYIRDSQNIDGHQKPLIMWVIVCLGLTLCFSWLSYLSTIKKTIDLRNNILIAMEKYLPLRIFTILLEESGRIEDKNSLTIREMFVPISFTFGYIFFAILILFFK